ncbi:MAG: FdhF/YdeP family oxidoreductase [Thermoanaerobaculia bacterium]|nr:FdhF/YdeP family oxidoreductase [Thermoanaerobaculia bacterium]
MSDRLRRQLGPFREILRTAWQNRDRPGYAWRILNGGVCDGCALGTDGMRDWTIDGIHLCWIRLNLLRLNTMPALDPERLRDVGALGAMEESELRALGRIPFPLRRRRGESSFSRLSWEEALESAAARLRAADPRRLAFYLVSRGTVNETYYAAQKAARYLGTNHVDNSARICHSSSTVGLKQTIGYAATTCSYRDLLRSDLIVFLGSDAANNQPVVMKYLHLARKRGTRVVVVNPYREPGMERYWVPSNLDSALLGTEVCDRFYQVRVGGDIAFLNGVLKHLVARGWMDEAFIREHTEGFDELVASLAEQSWEELERASGLSRLEMFELAELYAAAGSTIFVWSMGLTMHRHGVANVRAVANLALARGSVGRPGAGLMPIRGHSGVQGGAEMGCVPNVLPGDRPMTPEAAAELSELWGFEVPSWRGHYVAEMIDAAASSEVEALYCVGSNLLGVLPDTRYVRGAMEQIPLRIHHDIVLNPQMLVEPLEEVLVLPATTRYELAGGGTETSTERRVIFSPEIPGPRIPEARDEWRVMTELAARVRPERAEKILFAGTPEIRREIARVIPLYDGIQELAAKGDQFQWGGAQLCEGGRFARLGGRARFRPERPPDRELPDDAFHLSTRRGKQFNSVVFGERDMITGADRDGVLMATEDMVRLSLEEGDRVRLTSDTGELTGRARAARLRAGTVMVYWPEANTLVPRGVCDPESGIPAYRDAVVRVERLEG